MIKVGVTYRANGRVNLKELPLKEKLGVFISHTIDSSAFLSGDMSKLTGLKDAVELKKVDKYIEAIQVYLSDPKFEREKELYIIYDIDDECHIIEALSSPEFSVYSKHYLKFNRDLLALQSVLSGAVLVSRIV